MALESNALGTSIAIFTILAIALLSFSYLQIQYGILVRSPFAPPLKDYPRRLLQTSSLLTKAWITFRWFYIHIIHRGARMLFIYPETSMIIFSILPAAILLVYSTLYGISIESIILVTLLYASILLFKEIFLTEYPLVKIRPGIQANTDGDLEIGYQLSNIGSKDINDLTFFHRIYDAKGRWLGGVKTPPSFDIQSPLTLSPGEISGEFRIPLEKFRGFESEFDEWNIIEADTHTPLFIEISADPRIGHRFLGDRELIRYDPDPGEQRQSDILTQSTDYNDDSLSGDLDAEELEEKG